MDTKLMLQQEKYASQMEPSLWVIGVVTKFQMHLCIKVAPRTYLSTSPFFIFSFFSLLILFRPLREIFQNKVVKQQLKMAEKSLFVTKEKWEVFVTQNMVFTTATLDYDCLPVALG